MSQTVAELRKLLDEGKVQRGIVGGVPVPDALSRLLPGGLSRQLPTTLAPAIGATSLAMALAAPVTRTPGYIAVVDWPNWGWAAARDYGMNVDHVAYIPDSKGQFAEVVAAMVSGVELIVARPPHHVPAKIRRRIETLARQHHCGLLIVGEWAGAGAALTVSDPHWYGAADGRGRLKRRSVTVRIRRRSGGHDQTEVWLPGLLGEVTKLGRPKLVERWWSGVWGRWHRIMLRLECGGPRDWVLSREGPDGESDLCYYEAEWQARAELESWLADDRYEWRKITTPDEAAAR